MEHTQVDIALSFGSLKRYTSAAKLYPMVNSFSEFYDLSIPMVDTKTAEKFTNYYQFELDIGKLVECVHVIVAELILKAISDDVELMGSTVGDGDARCDRFTMSGGVAIEEQTKSTISQIINRVTGGRNYIESKHDVDGNVVYKTTLQLPRGITMLVQHNRPRTWIGVITLFGFEHYFTCRHQNNMFDPLDYMDEEMFVQEYRIAMLKAFPYFDTLFFAMSATAIQRDEEEEEHVRQQVHPAFAKMDFT